jgi:RHS repeat-associated protein
MNGHMISRMFRMVLGFGFCILALLLLNCGGGGGGGDDDDNGNGTIPQYQLTVTTVGQGSVTLAPPGGTYDENTLVALIAVADADWSFSAWSGGASGSTATTAILMDADKTVTATFVQNLVQDTEAPTWPAGSSAASADIGATFLSLTWDEAQDNEAVTRYRIFKNQVLMDTTAGNKTEIAVTGLSMDTAYTFSVEAGDAAGNWSAAGLSHTATTADALPLDPEGTAPDLNTSTTTRMRDASAFLYTGPDAIQKGVVPGSIEDHRVAVIRGMVKDEDGLAISGVTVSILSMPQLGRTTTRADGAYDIAVNGGDLVKIFFEKNGFLPVKRQQKVPWQNYVRIEDVVMVPRDINFTPIALRDAVNAQIAQGSQESDADGTRQAKIVVPKGVAGELALADGTRQSLDNMNLRLTEYTVGDNGPQRMPAEMPPNIAYTYAMDLSIDEAVDINAADVVFDDPLYFYLDNFLGFPTGIKVPTGYYDEDRGVWVPSESGLVIKVLSVNGDTVTVDTDGDDLADDTQTLAAQGFTDEELTKLSETYAAGDTLWRVPIDHFSSWDCNFGAYPPSDADIPWFKPDKKNRPDPCKQGGSIIDTANMGLGESVALVGLPFKLYYRSNRMPGFTHSQEIRIWDDTVSDSLQRILVRLNVAGQLHAFEFEKDFFDAFPESFTFTWDGRDVYGRSVQGSVPMIVETGYVYDGEYEANENWGETIPDDVTATEIMVDSRQQIGLWNQWTAYIGGMNPRGLGLGGWMPDIHHAYDPASQTLFSGDGEQKSAEETDPVVLRVAGTGQLPEPLYLWYDDGNPATQVNLGLINDIAAGPDGSLYIAEGNRGVLRVTPDGLIRRVTGDLITGTSEDGIDATQAAVVPIAIAIGPDESIYISENDRIRKITPDGLINTIAGDGQAVYGPEGGPAMGAAFEAWKIAVAPDGNVYILDMDAAVVRKIGTDDRLTLFAGTLNDDQDYTEAYTGEGGRAKSATFHLPMSIALGSDGSMYVADLGAHRVLRILPNGIITTVAGNGIPGNTGDGGPAGDASLMLPRSLAMGPDNALYIGCAGAVRKVAPNGIISTVGGGATATGSDDGIPATQAALGSIMGLVMGPANNLIFFEGNLTIRKIATAFGDFSSPGEISIPDKDTNSIFVFDENGQHMRTVDIWTGAVQWEFEYDLDGHLWKITDVDGDETIIDYDLSGNPTAITPPHANATSLTVDADGYLEQISDPAGNTHQFVYSGTDGLLTEMTTPNADVYAFEYYDDGRLKKDSNPEGGSQTLVREALVGADGYKVSVTTALGRETTYETAYLDEGGTRIIKTYPHGRSKTIEWFPDAGQTVAYVDGTDITLQQGPDPRFGMQIPIPKLLTEATPGGLTRETRMTREVQLGTITDTISINDRSFSLVYDELSQTFTLTTPEGRENVVVLNDKGRIESMQTNAMAPTSVTYDSQGRAETISVGSRSYQMTYDGDGFLSMVIDPLLGETEFVRDAAGRILTKILPDDREISFGYDDNGNVRVVTPPGRPAHTLGYTSLDSLGGYDPPNISGVSPDVTTFTYNLDGQVTTVNRPGSEDITITYDDAGRQLTFGHPHDVVTATYDGPTGKLTGLSTFEGIDLSFGWDGFLLTDVAWTGPFEKSLQGHYNNDFRITEIRIEGSSLASFSYDEDGLLIEAGSLSLTRDINGQVTRTTVGDITTDISYDPYGQPLSFTAETGGTSLMTLNYNYDLNGQITGLTETIQGVTSIYAYTYDVAGRLTNVTKDAVSVAACTFDSNSNRIAYSGDPGPAAATYDEQDRMLTYGDAAYGYSDAGTLQTKTVNTDITTYNYDAAGNLRGVTLPDGTVVSYLIDGINRRVGKQVDGSLVQGFIYLNQLAPIAELDGGGNVISRFIYGAKAHVPQLMIKGGITYRIISDHLGSPRLVVNTSDGTIVQRIDYDAFGNPVFVVGPADFQPFGFAGGLYDSHTGLVRFGARDYDPETGRWTKKDPILFAGGDSNLYGYVLANPVNWIDPTGNVSPFDANGNLGGIKPGDFRRIVGREFLDAMPSSQAAADRAGAVGDSLLDAATMGTVSGKDLRQAAGVDIVNECSDTYKETQKYSDPIAQGIFVVHGAAGLKTSIDKVSRLGSSKYLSDFHNTWDLSTGVAGSIQTFTK